MAKADTRLAVDLDGVLTEHPRPLARAASARFGIALPERAFVDSAGLHVPDAVRDWVYGDDGPASRLNPAPGGAAFLQGVVDEIGRHNVIVITARPAASAPMTLAWLKRHGFPEVEVFFADDKVTVATAQGCLYAIEDSGRHARNYAASGITCFLLASTDQGPDGFEDRIVRVEDLTSIGCLLAARLRGEPGPNGAPALPPLGALPVRPQIVVSDAIHPGARAELARQADIIEVDGTDLPALLAAITDADALVVRSETQVTKEVLGAATKLRVVARAGVGVDNIDLQAATRAGVLVLNAPGANANSAGEHTIALLLAITRQLPQANASTHAGRWERKKLKPIDLRGRTVGIVGLGRVGSVVAKRLRAFEMDLIGHDPYIDPHRFTELGVEPVDYPTLLERADVVTFHVPATRETTRMLDAAAIERLKPTAIVLNAARGEVVDQDALAAALQSGRIAAAGVDVFPHEPCTESPLFGLPNAVLTPHTGGSSAEALAAVGAVIASSTLAALRGEAVANAVNMPAASVQAVDLQRLSTVAGAAGHLIAVLEPDRPAQFSVAVRGLVPADVVEHVTGAALSEALQRWADRRVTPVNARLVAQEVGLQVRTTTGDTDPSRIPEFSFEVVGENQHHVTVSWDRVNASIIEVDRFSLERGLAGDVLITHHRDQPGVIGQMGTILGRYGVNIAGMQVGRHERGGEALMVTNVDDAIPEEALAEIKAISGMETAYVVSLPPAGPRPILAPALALAVPQATTSGAD